MLKFLRGSLAGSVAFSITTAVASYILLMLITRWYGEADVAYYLYVVTWALVLHLSMDFAFEQCAVHYAKNSEIPIWLAWRNVCLLKLVLVFALIVGGSFWELATNGDFPQPICFLMVPVFYLGPIYELLNKNRLYAGIVFVEKLLLLILAGTASLLTADITVVFFLYFLCSSLSFTAQIFFVREHFVVSHSSSQFSFLDYARQYYSIYIVLLAQIFYGHVSRLIIDSKAGSSAFVIVSLAFQLVNSISLVQSQVDRHVRPRVVSAIYSKSVDSVKTVLNQYAFFYLLPLIIGSILLSWLAPVVVLIVYGDEWGAVGPALARASPLIITIALMRLVDVFVVSMGFGRTSLAVNLSISIGLFSSLFFMPAQGIDYYINMILFFQAIHVLTMLFLLWIRARSVLFI